MYKIKLFTILLLFAGFNFNATAQNAGDNDPTFNPTDIGFGYAEGANNTINTTLIQPDGKIIIGGNFTSYNGTTKNKIARLNADGILDTNFDPGTGVDGNIFSTTLQLDGKIIIGGIFTSYNGIAKNNIARLNSDGSLDNSFSPGNGADNDIRTINLQPDGKIIIGGGFTFYDGISRKGIARLNADGTLDTNFDPGTGVNNRIYTTILQPDGKIFIGGSFVYYNGINMNSLARLNTDGSLDTSFNIGTGTANFVFTSTLQPDGKIIIGGQFNFYNGVARKNIARLNSDGSLDISFDPGTGANNTIYTSTIQPDGKIIIGGDFTSYNGTAINRIARLNTDGTLDTTFNLGIGANNIVYTISLQTNGQLIIGGGFWVYNGTTRIRIARLNSDGTLDNSFNPGTGADNIINTFALQPDEKLIIGGDFSSYNGIAINRIARLNTYGSLDTTFNPGTGVNREIYTCSIQPDGKIIIGGDFTSYNGTAVNRIARLNTDGSLDATFNPGIGANNIVYTISLQPNGQLIIGGVFWAYNGTSINRIARLNTDGTLDTTFNLGVGSDNPIYTSTIQPDGKIIIGGNFSTYNGLSINKIARLNTDGSLDTSFNPGTGLNGIYDFIGTSTLQPNGKIIIGGEFTSYDGIARNRIARLNSDGTLDTSFNPGTGADSTVNTSVLQPDGKIIIGGDFTSYNGTSRNRIARLNMDGSIDTVFNPGTGTNGTIYSSALQPDGNIIIGGGFTSYNGIGRNRIARILNCGATANYTSTDNSNGNYTFTNTSTGSFNQTHWAFGDGTTSTATNPNHTFNNNGTYVVVLTVHDSTTSCTDYYLDTMVVTGVVASAQCFAGFVMYSDAGGVTVVNSSTGTNLTYLWDFGDGNTSNAQFPTHTYATTDNYYLCLTVDDGAGCVDMYCDSIGQNGVVFNKQTGFTINVIAPPLATQVNEQTSIINGLTIYPNPSSGIFIIEHSKENIPFIITDISGRVINTGKLTSNKTNIDLSKVQKGVYLLKIGEQTTKLIRQ